MKKGVYWILLMIMVHLTLGYIGCDGITDGETLFYTLTRDITGEGSVGPESGVHEFEEGATVELEKIL